MRLVVLPGVFRPRSDSWLLASLVADRVTSGDTVLDPFTGSGVLAIAAARRGAVATAIDISRRAVLCARLNARLNGVKLRAVRAACLDPLDGRRFSLIVANPPYLPGTSAPVSGARRAWEGGPNGRRFIDALCDQAPDHLSPGGRLLLVHSSVCGEAATVDRLQSLGFEVGLLARQTGELGPLLATRAPALRRNGHPIEGREEILVFEGRLRR